MNEAASGAQSVERALAVLKAVGEQRDRGASAAELAAQLGLNRTTAHRLLGSLAAQGFLERGGQGRFFLGRELVSLGMVASARNDILARAGEVLARLSAQTGDTAFVSTISGFDSVCLRREEGAFPIRTQVLWPGQRHPLGIGAGSLAMLAALPEAKVEEVIAANADRVAGVYPRFAPQVLRELVGQTIEAGYAVNEGMIQEGSWAVGVAILGADGLPVGALSLSAIEQRMTPSRRGELAEALQAQLRALAA